MLGVMAQKSFAPARATRLGAAWNSLVPAATSLVGDVAVGATGGERSLAASGRPFEAVLVMQTAENGSADDVRAASADRREAGTCARCSR